ncbi:LLM class flavin-dependent oxidoreductase [Rhizorhabdus wittichii DC-6]|jgi:alkanesulfonate monooxygenase SsuD/methylene tetrahydromethanopterin reductase-like flavin-dependent oxidoreductase (luciferase family)|uniref:Luciferase family protein n=2 Tax=Rhizorhabdus wittichii TaxID=160791 RepID=A0A9J9H973_RHIWR|nr:LLM class flavin-dependent oxidoreductase [Rhizorhabdus wittichii]ABQ67182.1 luciferase family protein [Rhizorhabdus wittichii RW1]ARR56044.1 LLM class flavin-dependent oxidoreductase [Rhizorhabdus wittichii DC-6]QTH23183.1 LLM class flavin-dependent oxidoreductase [Rhizorhabdus wittichii]
MSNNEPAKPNQLRNANRLKLGVFGTNGNGAAFTHHPDRFRCSWDANVRLARTADRLGLEAFVSAARWKAFGGDGHYSGDLMETFSWAGGIAAVTERISVISTLHVTLVHPVFAAKAAASVDLISGGRAGLNLVCGWYPAEMDLFGVQLKQHADRYALADEWVDIFNRLWTGTESFDFDGDYFRIRGGINQPRPVQPRPFFMNAGGSPRGQAFAGQNCDVAFIIPQNPDPAFVKTQVDQYRSMAREKYGREIQVWMSAYVVQRDTAAEAQDYAHAYIVEQGDDPAVEHLIRENIPNAQAMPDGAIAHMSYAFKAGYGGYPLVGTAEDIAGRIEALSTAGVDGILMTWLDYEDGLARLAQGVLPRLEAAGLRAAADKA